MPRKHNYPSNRRSPVQHTVKTFKRGQFTVKGHSRGSGKRVRRVVIRVGNEIERLRKERLLADCFKGTKAERISVRIALREHYPALWIEAGFTGEMDMRRKAPEVILIKPKPWERSRLPY